MKDNCPKSLAQTEGLKYYVQITEIFKDGAYYCYRAYVLRIGRYADFLWVVSTNIGIFLRGLKLFLQ